MEDFLKEIDAVICTLWNALYAFLCDVLGEEVDESKFINTIFKKDE